MESQTDTIVAAATPPGRAAIGVVRLSGPRAVELVAERFRGVDLRALPGDRLAHGRIADAAGAPIDDVVVALFRGPRSYTGEDVVEISCHGNPVLLAQITELFIPPARLAGPGEFTRRALANGKLDLSQAEAVATLIAARSDAAARGAIRQLAGGPAREIRARRRALLEVLAAVESHIDFPDQDLDELPAAALGTRLAETSEAIAALAVAARRGRPLAEVPSVVLAGARNAGKSSLLNALCGRARAIVTGEPGTTRDLLDVEIPLGRLVVRLVDTAGEPEGGRESGDVEREGIRRGRAARESADRVLIVLEGSREGLAPEEIALLRETSPERAIVVANKADLPQRLARAVVCEGAGRDLPVHDVSARTGAGVAALSDAIERSITGGDDREEVLVCGQRQEAALENARRAGARAAAGFAAFASGLDGAPPLEITAEELRTAANALGEITGERVGADVLDVIFSSFCIGK